MTDQELTALRRWQESPEGNVYMSVRDLDNAIDGLVTLSQSREGMKFLAREMPNIKAAMRRLCDLLLDFHPAMAAE
ncbi:MAG TPA: hypothetical protein VFW94_15110 [Candidatus Acidoferrales bacterium]|nr:hypothetical protein [Candidatus Acidoferrales bacterium]